MIHAFFDDSADSKMEEFSVCGGVFGAEFNLDVVDNLWFARTRELVKPFRSTECECQHGQFAKWSREACVELFSDLVGILAHPVLKVQVIATSVPIPEYREIFPGSDRNDPYRLAIRHVLIAMARIARKKNDRVKCWFERGPRDADIKAAHKDVSEFRFVNAGMQGRLAGLEFGDKSLPLLQAADLAAREGFKAHQNFGHRPFRKPLVRLWEQAGIVGWSREFLRRLRDAGDPLSIDAHSKMPDEAFMMEMRATLSRAE
jgi:hypothetical protein